MSATNTATARVSGGVAAVEGSAYEKLSGGEKTLVSKTIDSYMNTRGLRDGESYEDVVNNLRNLFSTEAKLAELKRNSTQGVKPYNPGYAVRGGAAVGFGR